MTLAWICHSSSLSSGILGRPCKVSSLLGRESEGGASWRILLEGACGSRASGGGSEGEGGSWAEAEAGMRLSRVSGDTCGSCSNLLQRSGVHHVYYGTRSKSNLTRLPNMAKMTTEQMDRMKLWMEYRELQKKIFLNRIGRSWCSLTMMALKMKGRIRAEKRDNTWHLRFSYIRFGT